MERGKFLEVFLEVVLTIVLTPILPSALSAAWGLFLYNSAMFSNAARDYPMQMVLAVVVSFALGLYLGATVRILRGYVGRELARRQSAERQDESARQAARNLPYDSKLFLRELDRSDHIDVQKARARLDYIKAIDPKIIDVSEIAHGVLRVTLTDSGRYFVAVASDILAEAKPDVLGMWWEP